MTNPLQEHHRHRLRRRLGGLAALLLVVLASMLLDILLGPADLGTAQLWRALLDPGNADPVVSMIVWENRVPQALLAVIAGLSLGLAGAEMQTILNNPLASPFTLGLSSAAAFGAALAMVLGLSIPGVPVDWVISFNAFAFAMAAAALLDLILRRVQLDTTAVVLFGIAMVFSFNSLVALLQFVATMDALQGLVFWTMGSLTRAGWPQLGLMSLCFLVILPWSLQSAWRMTALRLGSERAASFGVDVHRLRRLSLLRISLLVTVTVAFVGTIGFIGLIAPHMARRLFGEDHRFYLPGAALSGALILSLASLASRNIAPGMVVPVGIVTSLVGIPLFVAIVLRHRSRG